MKNIATYLVVVTFRVKFRPKISGSSNGPKFCMRSYKTFLLKKAIKMKEVLKES